MLRVALTGGLCSGKSTVAELFAELGVPVLDADRIGHELLEPGTAAAAVVREFGPEILDANGRISRARLGALVFAEPARRRRLNAILHPLIREQLAERLAALAAAGAPLAIAEIVLVIESGLRNNYDRVVVVTAPEEVKIARFVARGGGDAAAARARLAAQLPDAEKARQADYVIDNGGGMETLRARVASVYRVLRAEAEAASAGGQGGGGEGETRSSATVSSATPPTTASSPGPASGAGAKQALSTSGDAE